MMAIKLHLQLTSILMILSTALAFSQTESHAVPMIEYDADTSFRINEPISFPDITVTYKGEILPPGHEKISSLLFEVRRGKATKQVVVPPLSMGGTVVRFGVNFYRIFLKSGAKIISVRRGLW